MFDSMFKCEYHTAFFSWGQPWFCYERSIFNRYMHCV